MLVPVGMCALRDRRGGGGRGRGGEREGGSRIAYAQEVHSIPRKDRGPRMHPRDEGVPAQCDWMGESPPNIRANKGGVRSYRQRMMDGMLEGAKERGNGMNHDSVMWRSDGV